jgi:hypothetical protein
MPKNWRDDEQLLADLGEAVRIGREVPARFIDIGKAAFAWHSIDAELAELSHDSATSPLLAGTRAEPATLRALTFVASCLTIEVEVTADALLGQVVPPQAGQIEVHGQDGPTHTAPVDDVGWFAVRPLPMGMFRLHVRLADGAPVLTEWVRL